ncbi:MAG: penicillin-binding protein 1C [Hyphomicrobium sp.]|nr:MAG: penicillin-binding protein 1C [Hyphomicrobium sp.]
MRWAHSTANIWRRAARHVLAAIAAIALLGYGAIRLAMSHLGPPPIEAAAPLSPTVLDRDGHLLRAFTTRDGKWRLPVEASEVDARYLKMLFAFEDRRFHHHGGVDPVGVARAVTQAITHRRLVSGASTLTMQTARLIEGRHDRSSLGKLWQMVRAWQIEQQLPKEGILGLYLRLAPFGGNIEGVRAASLAYFGKEPKRLSVGEAALLVALPQSPEARRPDRSTVAATRARDRVLDVAVKARVISAAEATRAKSEIVSAVRREFPKHAPHLAEAEVRRQSTTVVHRLTISRELQKSLETLAETHVAALGQKLSAAILALDHTTGEVLAYVGSAGYLDDARLGAIDMVQAVRSPGSTLKPIIYGIGFEHGVAHPETLIEDRPARFGTYAPKNFDEEFRGTVTVRSALANSLNIPAVKMLEAIGPQRLVGRFQRAGFSPQLPQGSEPTLAVALGGIGFRLEDVASMYASLARGGTLQPLFWRQEPKSLLAGSRQTRAMPRLKSLLDPVAAWYVSDILKDAPPPPAAVGGRIAYKTGTSYGYRDAWAAGYDGRHTIVVWVGRPDGTSTPGMMGRTAAAPILFDAFQRLGPKRVSLPSPPSGVTIAHGANLPISLRRFREAGDDAAAGPFRAPPVLIAFPPDRSEIDIDLAVEDLDPIQLKAEGGALPLTWLIDGAPIPSEPGRRDVSWQPSSRGFIKLSVIDAEGRADRVTVRLK